MLSVVLIWIYVIATTYLTGFALLKFITSLDCMHSQKSKGTYRKYNAHFRTSYIVAGLVVNTIYAEIYSLFEGVGLVANFLMITICVVIAVYYRNELIADLVEVLRLFVSGRSGYLYLAIFLVMAYGSSHGIMHYDSDLYHAQAIHWIEDYGVIKGLGNLHVRLAYNSASFALSALYSLSFLSGKSFHVMAGFCALMLAWECIDIKDIVRRGYPILSDFARVMGIYYLFTIFDEMVAPASDYFLSTFIFYIVIRWLDMNVKHEKSYVPYIMLSLLGVYAVTIKLSAAPIMILAIIPIYRLLANRSAKTMKAFGLSVLLAVIIVVPFLVRNVIISGWLVYPFTSVDLFDVAWKIPKGLADYDAKEIKTYGRGFTDVATYGDMAVKDWIGPWFAGIHGMNKIMLILDIAAILVFFVCLIYFFAIAINKKAKFKDSKVLNISDRRMVNFADFLTISGTMVACLVFWLFTAPLIRYGEVYVCLTFAIIFGRLLIRLFNYIGYENEFTKRTIMAFALIFVIWLLYKGVNLVRADIPGFNSTNFLAQQDYGQYDVESFEISGVTFYYPKEGDRIGYKYFPAATRDLSEELQFIGYGITSGIVAKQEN
ncbi:LIC_10190 family membrane protein [Butyrivibrio proteoclasticus]|uniref:LIC_10190 family membrane protein n=1 Tax=Butyrivibrio proteoclasticus TaxID=43305 RepID=UPI000550A1DF|nr:hypothetical protein [Butyrivibrio proteoclasticus]